MTREPWLFAVVAVAAALDALVAVLQHVHFETGLDLSLADQAIWHYSHFQAPFSSILGKDILGDHFSPLVAVLTPLYWIWSDPRMLLIAQSVLVSASTIPVFLFASRRLGRGGGYAVAIAYACYWATQVGVVFDFHEVAFAPLLIALVILFADERRWIPLWISVVLLLGVKEDMALLVVFLGLLLLTQRERAHGIALIVAGIAWYELAVGVAIPDFSGGAGYAHWTYQQLGHNLPDALWGLIKAPWKLFTIGLSPSVKVTTLLALFAPFLFLAVGSPLFILAIPLLAERFLSTNPLFWHTYYQYSMPIAPVIAMAAADALARVRRLLPARWPVVAVAAGAMVVVSVVLSVFVISASSLSRFESRAAFSAPPYARGASAALAHVPSGASLATVNYLLAHASERDRIGLIGSQAVTSSEYVVANLTDIACCAQVGVGSADGFATVLNAGLAGMTPVYFNSGWLVARHPPPGQVAGNGVLTPMPAAATGALDRLERRSGQAIAKLLRCLRAGFAFGAAEVSCFAGSVARYAAVQRSLSSSIAGVAPTLSGGCADLARAAVTATDQLVADLRLVAGAASSGRRIAFLFALAREQSDNASLALIEQAPIFLTLCSPR